MIAGVAKIGRNALRLKNRFVSGAVILLYHRIAEDRSDPWSLCVAPKRFAEHLEVIRRCGLPVSLPQICREVQDRRRFPRGVAITFDDGYADNLANAKPLLERYDVPATVFAVSGAIDGGREFWWDELERLILQPGHLPDSLDLEIRGRPFRWASSGSRRHEGRKEADGAETSAGGERRSLYYALWEMLRELGEEERGGELDRLAAWSGAESGSRPTHRPLSADELAALNRGGLVEIGSHTVTHPFLSKLPPPAQREEIERSKVKLEEILGRRVESFAYPHGDYAAVTAVMVEQAGYACACAASGGSVRARAGLFQLPRIAVENWDGDEFSRRLYEWFRE